MTEDRDSRSVLHRMARGRGDRGEMSPQTPPPSSSRILRVGMEKAAAGALALPLSVTGVSDEELSLDAMIEGLDEDGLILGIEEGGVVVGIATLDLDFISAAVEMQTIGRLQNAKPAKRSLTNTDAALARPLVAALLANLAVVGAGTPIADWVVGCQPAGRLPAARAISLVLADVDYRICRLPCDLGVADRQGEVVLALPVRRGMTHHDVSAPVEERQSVGWADAFTTAVLSAPAQLDAVIYRARVPLYRLEALQVGQVLPLAGADAAHVQIVVPGGMSVGAARLGQAAGMRAIRLEGRVQLSLDEGILTPRPEIAVAEPEKEQPPDDPGAMLAATG